ncbi:MAG TPA: acylase [Solirubrobacteraceae bacterium]|jgi:acyl-homoserine-lactone acylase
MRRRCGFLTLLLFCLLTPVAQAYDVTIRRTEHGIPHLLAKDFGSLAYGYGYALVQDNVCTIADSYVTVRGERSKYFGPDATYQFRGNGTTPNNLNSDFFYKRIIDEKVVEKLIAEPAPRGPKPELLEGVKGYVAGYNQALRDGYGDDDPTCKGAEWVRPISEMDVYHRFYQLALLASAGVAIDGIGGAQPPTPDASSAGRQAKADAAVAGLDPKRFDELLGGIGSNAVALGKDATENGSGLLLGNPHFPWDGSERFYQSQLTIPGKLDVAGGSLIGVPLILIGHTQGMAWSHTVSTARRFTGFELRLVPGSPTTYLVDGQPREMVKTTVTVQARKADGTLEPRTRTLYRSEYGPILTSILGLPVFPWTPERAYALGDANAGNFRYLNHFFDTNRAQTVEELDAVERRYQGIPWVNTIAADKNGKAYYADIGSMPNVENDKIQSCSVPLGVALDQAARVQVLDGSRAGCGYGSAEDKGAVAPGILPPSRQPVLFRDDYVTNSNDSYWLSNPLAPLEGFSRLIGDERTARSPRTRLGLRIVQEGGKFSADELQAAVFNNRQYIGELWRDEAVAMCRQDGSLPAGACDALAKWDLHDDLDSRGAILFRRFAGRALAAKSGPFRQAFDPADPVNTPRGLNTENPEVRQALRDAVADLQGAGIPFDAPLRDFQYEQRGDEKIPIHGGPGTAGVFNAINVTWDPAKGYPNVPHGSSYVQVVGFGAGDCPDARTILTYSQSANPSSPYFADQTRMFSNKQWVRERFCEKDIQADPTLQVKRLGGPGAGGKRGRKLLSRVKVRRGKRGRLRVTFRLARKANVSVSVRRRGKLVKKVFRRSLKAGKRRVTVKGVRRRGRYRVRVLAVHRGQRSLVVKKVRVRRARR